MGTSVTVLSHSVQGCKALVSVPKGRVTSYWLTWWAVSSANHVCIGFV